MDTHKCAHNVNISNTCAQTHIRAQTYRHFHTQAYMCTQAKARTKHRRKDPETTMEPQVPVGPGWVAGAMGNGTGAWHSEYGPSWTENPHRSSKNPHALVMHPS